MTVEFNQMHFFKLLYRKFNFRISLQALTIFAAFIGVLLELHLSVLQEIFSSFGVFDGAVFVQARLVFGAIIIALTILNTLVNQIQLFKLSSFLFYLIFILYITLIIWLNRGEFGFPLIRLDYTISAIEFWSPIVFKYLVFFCIGYNLILTLSYRWIYLALTLLMFFVIYSYVDFEILSLDRSLYIPTANKGNYLFLGDATAISSLIVLACFRGNTFRIAFLILSLSVIFFIGSRTAFAVYFGVCLLFLVLIFKVRYVPFAVILLLIGGFIIQQTDFDELADKNKRMVRIFTEFEDDTSILAREKFAESGWEDIKNHPIRGRFAGQLNYLVIHEKSVWRTYMHNVFSYWRQFGLLAMAILVYFLVKYVNTLRVLLREKSTPQYSVYFLLGIYLVTESVISRSFAFSSAHIFFGLIISFAYWQYRKVPLTSVRGAVYDGYRNYSEYEHSKPRRRKRRKYKRKLRH